MGRFKIYDPKDVVKILKDPKYASCLLCKKRLKNVMGNIKRHYQQMHNIVVNPNGYKDTKSRRRSTRNKDVDNKPQQTGGKNEITSPLRIENGKRQSSYNLETRNGKKMKAAVEATSSIKSEKNTIPAAVPLAPTTLPEIHIDQMSLKRRNDSRDVSIIRNNTFTRATAASEQVENTNILIEGLLISRKSLQNNNKQQDELVPENNINHKKSKLNTETKETQTNNMEFQQDFVSKTYINNIQIANWNSLYQEEHLKCCIDTKTLLNIPLNKFQTGNTFQEALQTLNENIKLEYKLQTVAEHIDQMALKLRQEINKIVNNRLIYLKLDVASQKESNVMLINIQFIKDFELKVFTLSAVELHNNHLATYLKKKVLNTLESYQIDISRVQSIIKDNINVGESVKIKENDTDNIRKKDEKYDIYVQPEYCQHLCEQFPGHAVHFAACHIIQLLNENISQSRDSVKRLRLKMPSLNLKPLPDLDNTTSWISIYDMIKSLLNIREQVENNIELLVEVDWTFALKFEASFRPVVATALMLQSANNFIMGDFYREWLLCELELEELAVSNELALYLLDSLRKRKIELFKNGSFLAALYLDPRFCYATTIHFNNHQKQIAIAQLLQIFNKLKTLEINANNTASCSKPIDRYAKLEENIAAKMKITTKFTDSSTTLNSVDCQWLTTALEQLQFQERLPFNANILDYWKMVKYKNPILAKIAEIALAAPATQATINRALNAWPLMFMQGNKNVVSSNNVENILLLKLNQDLVDKISLES